MDKRLQSCLESLEEVPSMSEAMKNKTLIETGQESGQAMYSSSHASSVSLNDFSFPIDRQPPMTEKKEYNTDILEKQDFPNPYEDHSNVLKFKSPREECSPEDCCCCFYFIYLLFHQKDPSSMVSPVVKTTDRLSGYSFFKNISSTRCSIDSSSKSTQDCPVDDERASLETSLSQQQ